jgi:2-C-methyl-D-erythritol 4-phosphate cytidylyltransferase
LNTAIIVAAGSGQRFGGDIPKQFIEIGGKPIIIHTIEKFEACDLVDEIVLVVGESVRTYCENLLSRFRLTKRAGIATGGASRVISVVNGLRRSTAGDEDIVAVHDGVRPFVSPDEIALVISKAAESGAACLVADVVDTIKEVADGNIVRTVDRAKLRRALTPQAFRRKILEYALDQTQLDDTITDECLLVERLGIQIAAVPGTSGNIKITRPEDVILAEAILKQQGAAA